jgi:hypothetical protein
MVYLTVKINTISLLKCKGSYLVEVNYLELYLAHYCARSEANPPSTVTQVLYWL